MDHIERFKEFLDEIIAGLKDDIYTDMLMQCGEGIDDDVRKAMQSFIGTLNRRGVSSKIIFEAMMDAGREFGRDE